MQDGKLSPKTPLSSPSKSHFEWSPSARSSASTAPTTSSPDQGSNGGKVEPDAWDRLLDETLRARPGFIHLDRGYAQEAGLRGVARSFDWSLSQDSADPSRQVLRRRLGPTEMSYYLASRGAGPAGGVNDMYLHIGFRAPSDLVNTARILDVWKTILSRHILMSSSVEFRGYYDIQFVNRLPCDEAEFEQIARSHLDLRTGASSKAILDDYLNGDRLLSDERLSFLVISTPEESITSCDGDIQDYDFYLYSTHFIGDGMALHRTASEFFSLLAAGPTPRGASSVLPVPQELELLPPALENAIKSPEPWCETAWAAAKVDFKRNESKSLGGQAFPKATLGPRRTVVPTVSYSQSDSRAILATCKAHGATVASALFALSNLAYVRSTPPERLTRALPTNFYSALNVRGLLDGDDGANPRDWYHLAIGYYNIILPSFYPPSTTARSFWHQASSVRRQTLNVVNSRFLPSRTLLGAFRREERSIGLEKAAELAKTSQGGRTAGAVVVVDGSKANEGREAHEGEEERNARARTRVDAGSKPPNVSLMGLSMLGNLDGIYDHSMYSESGIELHALTTGSRQRPSGLLLFSYTFAGKLWISLGYDLNGFEPGVIDAWWAELLRGVDELLLSKAANES